MIDFACKEFKLSEIIKCALGLRKADLAVLSFFLEHTDSWHSAEDVAKKLRLNVTTVQRASKKLFEKDIIHRQQENLTGGGYVYSYKLKNKTHIRMVIMSIVERWKKKVADELEKW